MKIGAVARRPLGSQVFMILRPALRFFTGPRPPGAFAARRLAAVILPPLLFFAMVEISCVYLLSTPTFGVEQRLVNSPPSKELVLLPRPR
jgi:hypothetical protein